MTAPSDEHSCSHARERDRTLLKRCLDNLYHHYDLEFLRTDPLWFPHQYPRKADQEVVAFLACQFAYGNVAQIFRTLRTIFDGLGREPSAAIRDRAVRLRQFARFRHRFHGPDDLRLLLRATGEVLRRYGSIEAFFSKHHDGGDIAEGVSAFSREFLAISRQLGGPPGRAYAFFFPDPLDHGSACKRLNMFLRWAVRRDSLDLGLWSAVSSSDLIIPLDTHVARISRYIGLTHRKVNDWKTAKEITDALRELDPADPVKYDFSIARLGILRHCPRKRDLRRCVACKLYEVCLL